MPAKLSLYLIERPNGAWRDENAGHVIAALTDAQARELAADAAKDERRSAWFDPKESTVTRIGTAGQGTKAGVVLTDGNPG